MNDSFVEDHIATLRANAIMATFFDFAEIGGYLFLAALSFKAVVGVMLVLWALRGREVIS